MEPPRQIGISARNNAPRRELQVSDDIRQKADRISELFASLADTPRASLNAVSTSDKSPDKVNGDLPTISPSKTQPRSQDEFYQRVNSFQPGLWSIHQLSPLECASWGWKLLEKDVLQCVTCHVVVCAILPDKKDRVAYEKFFYILKNRLEASHKEACGWLYNPCPREFVEPLILSDEDVRNMKNSVQTLATLNSALPFLNNNRITAVLGADDEILNGLLKKDDADDEIKITAVLLVLCGWSKGQGSCLRCTVCRRMVGMWSLFTIADEFKKTESSKPSSTSSSSKKRKLSENNDNAEEAADGNKRVTRQSPRKLRSQDTPTPKRMKTRSKDDKMEDQNEEKREYLLITSPSTQVEKVEKKYFSPLDEHRYWCPWITKVDSSDDNDDDDPPKGFCIVTEQIRAMLQLSDDRKSAAHEKYEENVDGLRIIRNLLDEVCGD